MFVCQELEAERQARSKSEKQRGTLARELDDLGERLDEAGKCFPSVVTNTTSCSPSFACQFFTTSSTILVNWRAGMLSLAVVISSKAQILLLMIIKDPLVFIR